MNSIRLKNGSKLRMFVPLFVVLSIVLHRMWRCGHANHRSCTDRHDCCMRSSSANQHSTGANTGTYDQQCARTCPNANSCAFGSAGK